MIIKCLTISIFVLAGSVIQEPTEKPGNQLRVMVQNVKPGKGKVKVCLFDKEETFLKKAVKCYDVPATEEKQSVQVVFENLQAQIYAVSVYQDFNENDILDHNWLGLPVEPYGFSNNPSTTFGPPSFTKAAIDLNGPVTIVVKL